MANKYHLIFVDDETELRPIFEYYFEEDVEQGIVDMTYFPNAKECLSYLKGQQDVTNYIIVSDINMPEINGFEMLKKIQNDQPDIGFYVMSAYDTEEYKNEAKKIGVKEFFCKPVDISFVKKTIGQHFNIKFIDD